MPSYRLYFSQSNKLTKNFLHDKLIFMNFININDESVKTHLEIEVGFFVCEELYNFTEFDIIDCFDICKNFMPANYIISRENYILSY